MATLTVLMVLLLCASSSLSKSVEKTKLEPVTKESTSNGKGIKRQVFATDVLGASNLQLPPASTPIQPVAPVQTSISIEPNPVVLRQEVPRFITRTITQNVQVPVSVPVAVPVDRQVPVPVRVPVAVPVVHRVPVEVTRHVSVYYERRVPYPVRVSVPVPYPVTVERHIPVDRPVLVERPVRVPVPVPQPLIVERPVSVPQIQFAPSGFALPDFGFNGLALSGR